MGDRNRVVERSHKSILTVFLIVLIWSAIKPVSFKTWLLEASPAIIVAIGFTLTYKKFKFSTFTYTIILIHTIILLIGAKYSYHRNPLFNYLMERFDLSRNYYDRVGHFAQGFTPAIVAKELLLRKGYLKRSKMFYYIVISIVLAISAAYELIEFAVSKISGVPGYIILSNQGDEWDTQWDMIMALFGAFTALTIFRKAHDKDIEKISKLDGEL